MTTLVHNGCRTCFQTEGTCWRDDLAQRYRAAQSWWHGDFSRTRRRLVRPLMMVLLAPVFGALTGSTLATGLWFLARTRMMGLGLLVESTKLWR